MSESNNKKLVFAATGKFENFTRESLKSFIEEHGHILLDKISAKAQYLINNDVTSTSGKNKFAKENQIPIISEEDLMNLINKLGSKELKNPATSEPTTSNAEDDLKYYVIVRSQHHRKWNEYETELYFFDLESEAYSFVNDTNWPDKSIELGSLKLAKGIDPSEYDEDSDFDMDAYIFEKGKHIYSVVTDGWIEFSSEVDGIIHSGIFLGDINKGKASIYLKSHNSDVKTITIPSMLCNLHECFDVVKIKENSFCNLKDLEEVIFESDHIEIGEGAFQGCPKLKPINKNTEKKMVFAATGKFENFTRESLKSFIEEHGHILLDKISAKAQYLINNDVSSTSGKNKFAKENQIPIISEDEMIVLVGQQDESVSKTELTVSHNLDVNFKDLLGYYNKFPSGNGKLAKIVYLDDVLIDVASLTFEFSTGKQAYATCNSMVQAGDFLLLNDHQIVLVSNIVEALESNATTYNSIAYYKKCLKELEYTEHQFGIFYEEVEFDVEDQAYPCSEPAYDGGYFSIDLKEFRDRSYQSHTLIFQAHFGFISLKEHPEKKYADHYYASVKVVDELSINENFWDTYAEIFESFSKYGIPYVSDLDYIDKDQLKASKRINQLFPNDNFFEHPFFTFSYWFDVKKIENNIGREISSLLSVCFASTKTNSLSSHDVTHVIDGGTQLNINELMLNSYGTSLGLFKGYKELLIVCYHSNDEYELIASYDSSNGFVLIATEENQSDDNHSEDVPLEQGYLVEVKFDSNKVYRYNSKVRVNLGDVVTVSGKVNKEGTVVSIKKGWDDNFYMQEITEVVKSNPAIQTESLVIDNIEISNNDSFEAAYNLLDQHNKNHIDSYIEELPRQDGQWSNYNYHHSIKVLGLQKDIIDYVNDFIENYKNDLSEIFPYNNESLQQYNTTKLDLIALKLIENDDLHEVLALKNKELIIYETRVDKAKIIVDYIDNFYQAAMIYRKEISEVNVKKALIVSTLISKKYKDEISKSNVQMINEKPTYGHNDWNFYYPEDFIFSPDDLYGSLIQLFSDIEDDNVKFLGFVEFDV